MNHRALGWIAMCLAALALGSHAFGQPADASYSAVQSIFDARCTMCHSGAQPPLGLGLDSFERVMSGSVNGPAVVPNDPEASELVRRIRGTSTPRMPLTGPPYLSDEEIATIVDWIAAGAPGPAQATPDESENTRGEGATGEAASENSSPDETASDPAPGTFEHVHTIFLQRCASCHSANGVMGAPPEGLQLTSWETILSGGERTVVVPGSPGASELLRRVEGWSLPRMPLDGPPYLDTEQIESIRRWIERGAPGPDGERATLPVGAEVRLGGTLTARWEIDGFRLNVTDETRIDDNPSVGSRVEVRGIVTVDGGIRATRIRVE